ncbi:alpha/beta hydrolase [Roseisalinus antarcticus]|uniref:Thermostable monoacylglycerol lipase n=1 Tax=Roseisalinus antarcticus TaxID=254357 RepID=A0A1Y5SYZ5_9RHOB|nr:alpha/beta hydrolase [Roseisalinus antarcticus]SLN48357.1 Thermostable monoacylglycerol lipase [Roseisalinus antarcticus]
MLEGLTQRLAEAEARVPAIRPGCEKRVIWAGAPEARTALSVVYVHGFSASPEEIRPVTDKVAEALGANLFFTRLNGHGQDGPAMGRATFAAWRRDLDEAARIGAALGERVLWIGCSTGCTLIADALMRGAPAAGAVFVSPNFRLASRAANWVLDVPGVRTWGPIPFGRERKFAVLNETHARYWTPIHPTAAVFPMADAMRAVRRARLERIEAPALFAYSPQDRVVSHEATRAAAVRWGGPVELHQVTCGPRDDAMCHVIAGDVFSPGQTDGLVARILDWARRTGL